MGRIVEINLRDPKDGIYAYREKETGEVIYIGKDARMHRRARHLQHISDIKKDAQKINKILRDNPDKYVYEQILLCDRFWLESIEEMFIKYYKPKYNKLLKGNVELHDVIKFINKLQKTYNVSDDDIYALKDMLNIF